jgi:hypothetical protein
MAFSGFNVSPAAAAGELAGRQRGKLESARPASEVQTRRRRMVSRRDFLGIAAAGTAALRHRLAETLGAVLPRMQGNPPHDPRRGGDSSCIRHQQRVHPRCDPAAEAPRARCRPHRLTDDSAPARPAGARRGPRHQTEFRVAGRHRSHRSRPMVVLTRRAI